MEANQLTVCLDGRVEGVVLPPALRDRPAVTLAYTEDLHIGSSGVRATLLFDGEEVETFVPWAALYQVASDAGHVMFVDSVPLNDILLQQAAPEAVPESSRRERPDWLSLVP